MSVFLTAGTIIALQIIVIRLYSISGWAHFGSLVVSVAMFGFGLASAIMCLGNDFFNRHRDGIARIAFLVYGPLIVLGNVCAQQIQFNPIFLLADADQFWKLLFNFISYAVPFLVGALLLGIAFMTGSQRFQLTYASDMIGSGITGITCLVLMLVIPPEYLLLLPLLMWWGSALLWFAMSQDRRAVGMVSVSALVAVGLLFALPQISVSPYKGVSYAAKFPDSKRVYHAYGAHGLLEIYGSSYFHFAPGLSDMASLNMEELPTNTYLGMYIDSDGPIGIMKAIPPEQEIYYRFLPMHMPYLVQPKPDKVFIVQFGGGISTRVALAANAGQVTVAEGNPMILKAFADDEIRQFTGNILADPRLSIIPMDGQLFVRATEQKFKVIDLSLADSTGLSSPGGFAVTEKYIYTREAMAAYMRALEPGGVLAVTVWNKENPPKSTLRLFATMAEAGHQVAGKGAPNSFYVLHVPLSTTTVLYKQGGFTSEEITRLDAHCREMAFGVVYRPGERFQGDGVRMLTSYSRSILEEGNIDSPDSQVETPEDEGVDTSVSALYSLLLDRMMHREDMGLLKLYPFDIASLTDDRPYFSGYVSLDKLHHFVGRLEAISDEWGYLLLWFTLGQAAIAGLVLLSLPLIFSWRTIFSRQAGKFGILGYFFALGLGYILVEIALIGKFISVLGNAVISTGILITGMLISTGLGSLVSGYFLEQVKTVMPRIFMAIAVILGIYGIGLDHWLPATGSLEWRVGVCILLLFPLAFLMGFPFATGMSWLARLGKEHFFLWAWGINGMFSVMGAVLVPIVAVSVGLSANLYLAGALYLLAWPCLFALLRPHHV
ncbi:MAG: hypothetical protein HQL95_02530 [Magnetococcales bacterium]|nr:hypothetical protein [Magnetococcales bacterium]